MLKLQLFSNYFLVNIKSKPDENFLSVSDYGTVKIYDPEKPRGSVFEMNEDEYFLVLIRRIVLSAKSPILLPAKISNDTIVVLNNSMFSGHYVETGNLFRHIDNPIKVFNRVESPANFVDLKGYIAHKKSIGLYYENIYL